MRLYVVQSEIDSVFQELRHENWRHIVDAAKISLDLEGRERRTQAPRESDEKHVFLIMTTCMKLVKNEHTLTPSQNQSHRSIFRTFAWAVEGTVGVACVWSIVIKTSNENI